MPLLAHRIAALCLVSFLFGGSAFLSLFSLAVSLAHAEQETQATTCRTDTQKPSH